MINGVDCRRFLADLGVDIVTLPMTYAAPRGYCEAWRAAFYLFDVLEHMASVMDPNDAAVLLDCDCLCVGALDDAFADTRAHGTLTYLEESDPDADINGLSLATRRLILEEMVGHSIDSVPVHVGGEFLGVTGESASELARTIHGTWEEQLRRYSEGRSVLTTEEHVLSCAAWRLGLQVGGADQYCRRIWTSLRYVTSSERDLALAVWHLPAEKHYSLRRLWLALARGRGPLAGTAAPNRLATLARYCGIPRRGAGKWIRDVAWRAVLLAEAAAQRLKAEYTGAFRGTAAEADHVP